MKTNIIKAKIISNRRLKPDCWHLEFESAQVAKSLPGQFVNIRVSDSQDPLLRRPLSIHKVRLKRISVMYEVLGKGTSILSQRKPGDLLDMIGPLGNGFDTSRAKSSGCRNILIAGGMGVAPLLFLAEKLRSTKPIILIGGRSREHLLCQSEFKALGLTVKLATDDGTAGFKGRVTGLLSVLLNETKPYNLFACGPHPMLKAVALIAGEKGMCAQLSLEEHMACGIGACLGCVVLTKNGYRSVCKDGPVFLAQDLIW